MDSPPKFSETMDFIVQFLRAEGFYAAEEALIREIENRCPDGSSPTASAANTPSFAQTEAAYAHEGFAEEPADESASKTRPPPQRALQLSR